MRGIRLQLDSLISGDLEASFYSGFIDHKEYISVVGCTYSICLLTILKS